MLERQDFPVLVIDGELRADTAEGRVSRDIVSELEKMDFRVIGAVTAREGIAAFNTVACISCVVIDWDLEDGGEFTPASLVASVKAHNENIPIFLYTDKLSIRDVPLEVIYRIEGYVWKMEDTPDFIAGRIRQAAKRYIAGLYPPFFKKLAEYVAESRYSWHTPGHMGGVAFLKSPPGKVFFDFFGENALRADISVSVPELGSLLDHSGVVGEAERHAAEVFGADRTYFVTGGTSSANKIVWKGAVTDGDIVLVDRNCHKSVMHAIILTGAIPLYLHPTRNRYGIIGPIPRREFSRASILEKIRSSPLTPDDFDGKAALAVVTNSTYDGLCYQVEQIQRGLSEVVETILYDEAWFGYAGFHEIYRGRFGMHPLEVGAGEPTVFATQSTHKVLAAFSQGSMIHVQHGEKPFDHGRFNESYMMFTSTSPQYAIIASLDVAARMMNGNAGTLLIDEAIEEAVVFRKKMVDIGREIDRRESREEEPWWFAVWQPERLSVPGRKPQHGPFDAIPTDILKGEPSCWTLDAGEGWHGFDGMERDFVMLDPIKVTIITPGIREDGSQAQWGIPAAVVARFLRQRGIVVEKTGSYSFLVLFTMGITKGKSGTLIAELFRFKTLFDENRSMEEVFPDLVREQPQYADIRLQDFCREIHDFYREYQLTRTQMEMYRTLPGQVMIPKDAYRALVRGEVDQVPLREAAGRVPAVMLVPYPPGIPVIMPGERFTPDTSAILEYLLACEEFDHRYPGFENEVHGITPVDEDGRWIYSLYCVREE